YILVGDRVRHRTQPWLTGTVWDTGRPHRRSARGGAGRHQSARRAQNFDSISRKPPGPRGHLFHPISTSPPPSLNRRAQHSPAFLARAARPPTAGWRRNRCSLRTSAIAPSLALTMSRDKPEDYPKVIAMFVYVRILSSQGAAEGFMSAHFGRFV